MWNFRAALGISLALATGASSATQYVNYSWNFTSAPVSLTRDNGNVISFASVPSGGPSLQVSAFSSTNSDGSGNLVQATVVSDGGLGVLNPNETAGSFPDGYMVDNSGRAELLVFDAGAGKTVDWSSLQLSILNNNSTPDLTVWTGNKAVSTSMCLTGCGASDLTGANNNFVKTAFTDWSGTTNNPLTGVGPSRYLVVSGALGAPGNDKLYDTFKIGKIGGQAPEPQSMALLAIGFIAMAGMRFRSWKGLQRPIAL